MTEPDADGPFAGYWRLALGLPGAVDPAQAAAAIARLAPRFGQSLARAPLDGLAPPDPQADADAAFRRLLLARQTATLAALRDAGATVLPIKGYDACRLYEPRWVRILGDLDLLVMPAAAPAVAGVLVRLGFTVEPSPQGLLGVTSDVSFHPLVAPDGLVSVDLHTALDAYPLSAALTADAVFADALDDGAGLRTAAHHRAAAAVSNLAKERFGPYSWRHLIDLGRLAVRDPPDWPAVDRILAAAGLQPARATALGTLRRLGVPADALPGDADPAFGPAVALAGRLGHLRLAEPGRLAKVRREALWCYAPGTLAALWRFRLAGLLRPRSGLPPGAAATGSRVD